MGKPRKKPVIGIMGGIGSGKSTAAREFARLGCKVIDADKIAHELLERKSVKQKVAACFGQNILSSSGRINRKKLADIVFAETRRIELLNNIIHPLVLSKVEQLITKYKAQNTVKAIVLDMPLLLEVGWAKRCKKLIFVDCRPELRAKRAKKVGIFGVKQLKKRENFQISLDKKRRIADNIIDNNSGFAALAKQVADILIDVVNNG